MLHHFRSMLKAMIAKSGINAQAYSTHCLRSGRALDLMKLGLSIKTIKKLGRWKSNTVYAYLKWSIFSGIVTAQKSTWLIDNDFLHTAYPELCDMKIHPVPQMRCNLYLCHVLRSWKIFVNKFGTQHMSVLLIGKVEVWEVCLTFELILHQNLWWHYLYKTFLQFLRKDAAIKLLNKQLTFV